MASNTSGDLARKFYEICGKLLQRYEHTKNVLQNSVHDDRVSSAMNDMFFKMALDTGSILAKSAPHRQNINSLVIQQTPHQQTLNSSSTYGPQVEQPQQDVLHLSQPAKCKQEMLTMKPNIEVGNVPVVANNGQSEEQPNASEPWKDHYTELMTWVMQQLGIENHTAEEVLNRNQDASAKRRNGRKQPVTNEATSSTAENIQSSQLKPKLFPCPYANCPKLYATKSSLYSHQRRHHIGADNNETTVQEKRQVEVTMAGGAFDAKEPQPAVKRTRTNSFQLVGYQPDDTELLLDIPVECNLSEITDRPQEDGLTMAISNETKLVDRIEPPFIRLFANQLQVSTEMPAEKSEETVQESTTETQLNR